tara:strand:+ start:7887 stop:8129 length:243 start_codon:yes stop_codon:yes gene_type:complete
VSIIKANKVEIEVQEQTSPNAGGKYMTILSYEPYSSLSKEIISVVLTNTKPFIKQTIDYGNRIEILEQTPTEIKLTPKKA